MNLRDQLLKSGLAKEPSARKAEREVHKKQHQKTVEARAKKSDAALTEAEHKKAADEEAQRIFLENAQKEKEEKVVRQHGLDIITRGSLNDPKAKGTYYFKVSSEHIESVAVNELQAMQLAAGQLAIAYLPADESYRILSEDNAAKLMRYFPEWIVCYHKNREP